MQPEQSSLLLSSTWTKLKLGTRYAGQYNMGRSTWAMESLVQLKMLTNQLAWHGKFFVFLRLGVLASCDLDYKFLLWVSGVCQILSNTFKFVQRKERIHGMNKDFWFLSFLTFFPLNILINWQFVNDLHALISPTPQGTPLPIVVLGKVSFLCELYVHGKFPFFFFFYAIFNALHFFFVMFFQSKNALMSTFLFLDQFIWLSRTGIYKVLFFFVLFYLWCTWSVVNTLLII